MSATDPQPPPKPGAATHSVDLVVTDLAERKRHGIAKYGVAHQHDNDRDHLVDLYQELLDGCVYIRAEIERRKSERQSAAATLRAAAESFRTWLLKRPSDVESLRWFIAELEAMAERSDQ